ncbi:uncharacterized protein J3D65DRAFT_269052 [Phyllosticta citribraziliensis]|uniref:Uncharacterized protein n=1 Tax=Phyllosticta citribraziliensis TaxID=989973 RepID=A0ABR1M121_9PEZI
MEMEEAHEGLLFRRQLERKNSSSAFHDICPPLPHHRLLTRSSSRLTAPPTNPFPCLMPSREMHRRKSLGPFLCLCRGPRGMASVFPASGWSPCHNAHSRKGNEARTEGVAVGRAGPLEVRRLGWLVLSLWTHVLGFRFFVVALLPLRPRKIESKLQSPRKHPT